MLMQNAKNGIQSTKSRSAVAIANVNAACANVAARRGMKRPVRSSTLGAQSAAIITDSGWAANITPTPVDVRPCESAVLGKKGAMSEKLRSLSAVARQQNASDVASVPDFAIGTPRGGATLRAQRSIHQHSITSVHHSQGLTRLQTPWHPPQAPPGLGRRPPKCLARAQPTGRRCPLTARLISGCQAAVWCREGHRDQNYDY